ncbi:Nin one binding Zn-ribbon like-domain-containing protein [Endogone sp. FLAS-F59071]|nr:Nin one binding Zn-ribbon like-domain-containing protein [Endogone sp. FLAS-F59071]|eukprot:RUS17018.1 Nin one binding Zn-ribbon like-domain-containing protein [Endogone sp. FLAS-F59071]
MTTEDQSTLPKPASGPATALPKPANDKVVSLVVDSAPLLKAIPLAHLADKFYTVPEVIAEIRDERSREYLTRLPFEFQIKTPSEEALKAVLIPESTLDVYSLFATVVAFAKKTGDYAVLSVVDIKVLALTYMLEVEANGTARLRTEPVRAKTQAGAIHREPHRPKPVAASEATASDTSAAAAKDTSDVTNEVTKMQEPVNDAVEEVQRKLETVTIGDVADESKEKEKRPDREDQLSEESKHGGEDEARNEEESEEGEEGEEGGNEESEEDKGEEGEGKGEGALAQDEEEEEENDGDGEWITPENVHKHKAASYGQTLDNKRRKWPLVMKVACMTADYAMQNVLLQMRLNLLSTDGLRIKRIKTWVMRCHACFKVTTDMEKKFCPRCGNTTLMRTSCSTDEDGNVTYYLKKNFQYNLRGTKFAIPEPVGGRRANDIVLREDQREYQKALRGQRARKTVDVFDPDYVPTFGDLGRTGTGNNMFGTAVIGYGRKNPNVARRSGGRRKR